MPAIQLKIDKHVLNILFIHIPKTGGVALIDFWKRINAVIYLHNENNPIVGPLKCPSQHFHYEIIEMIFNIERFHYSFAIVRDPIERAKSNFLWRFRGTKASEMPAIEDWLQNIFLRYKSNPYIHDNHIRPQSDFVGPHVSKIYKYEDGLEHILIDVLSNLGITIESTGGGLLKRANTASQNNGIKTSDMHISQKAKQLIYDFYDQDFQNFEYK